MTDSLRVRVARATRHIACHMHLNGKNEDCTPVCMDCSKLRADVAIEEVAKWIKEDAEHTDGMKLGSQIAKELRAMCEEPK